MRKFMKGFLITSGILAGAGIALTIVSVCMGARYSDFTDAGNLNLGWNFMNHRVVSGKNQNTKFVDKDITFENIKNLDIEIGVTEMNIETYDGDEFKIEARDVPKEITYEKDGDTLIIDDESDEGTNWGWANHSPKITLYVPKNVEFKEVELNVGVGALKASDFKVKDINIDSGVGSITLDGKITGDAEISNGVGTVKLNLEGSEDDFNYNIGGGLGSIKIGSNKFNSIDNDEHIDNNASKEMDIDCGVGTIKVTFDK